jgi:AraC-like DNA-binding protein/ligand-binding sensor protein
MGAAQWARVAGNAFLFAFYDVIKCAIVRKLCAAMPRIIRRALYQKLRDLLELREFQRDFELLSGLRLAFVDELGMGCESHDGGSGLCKAMAESATGRAMCARLRHGLIIEAAEQPACAMCDAGLAEVVVPLRISGIPAGFFIFGGVAVHAPDPPARHKVRHLLRKAGVEIDEAGLDRLLDAAPVLPRETLAAYQRIANLAAKQIALMVTDQLANPEAQMPPAVLKACGFIRARALFDDVSLALVARHCAVSEGHLSRMFHHTTGLTFREYVAQVRVEHAKAMLLSTSRGVTEIAYESGFQSLSQFHRVFRKAFGTTPGTLRRDRQAASLPNPAS